MTIRQSKTSCATTIGLFIITFILLVFWIFFNLGPYPVMMAKGLHENAAWLAIDSTCPSYECNVRLGWGTKELPIDTVGQTLERWCVEVLYKNNQTKEKGKAALEIVLTNRDNDNPNNWKVVNTEYEADCGTMK